MNSKIIIFSVLLLLNLSWGTFSYAQEKAEKENPLIEASEEKKVIVFRDELERDTPRGTARSLLRALKNRDYKLAVEFLDLEDLPNMRDKSPSELARQLRIIFQ